MEWKERGIISLQEKRRKKIFAGDAAEWSKVLKKLLNAMLKIFAGDGARWSGAVKVVECGAALLSSKWLDVLCVHVMCALVVYIYFRYIMTKQALFFLSW